MLLVGGITLSQAVSDPRAVTLRWLRLGGLIALTLVGVALALRPGVGTGGAGVGFGWSSETDNAVSWGLLIASAVACVVQLVTVQLAKRDVQRVAATCGFVLAVAAAAFVLTAQFKLAVEADAVTDVSPGLGAVVAATPWSAGLLGGFLMTMLLGHAYLTAGNEMTQAPFRRLVLVLALLLAVRLLVSLVTGAWPAMRQQDVQPLSSWSVMLMTARYGVGLVVPGAFVYMIHDCVKRRANQSATGILYVATILVVIGEGAALALVRATGFVF